MIRALSYDPTGIIYFKTNITHDYEILPQRCTKIMSLTEPEQLHSERLKISKKKWDHLQELKVLIPPDCHNFYNSIPFEI